MGYEVYTSALADVLCEPSLNMPLTVGMYARWGSGKSFVLRRLQGICFINLTEIFIWETRFPSSSVKRANLIKA